MKRLIIATTAALLLGAPLAFAAANTGTKPMHENNHWQPATASTMSDRCTTLGQQFDRVETQHQSAKNYKQALGQRSEGKTLCAAHKESEGVAKIESALTMIGVKPDVKS